MDDDDVEGRWTGCRGIMRRWNSGQRSAVAEAPGSTFAHCAALTVFAVRIPWNRKPKAWATADALAQVLDLDMTGHWSPTARSYFGRVTKAGINAAVREGISDEADARGGAERQEAPGRGRAIRERC